MRAIADSRLEALARDLADAWRNGRAIPLPEAGQGATTRAEAYLVQDRVAALIGAHVVGWKVGATVRPVQLMDGHDGPLPGRIFADRCFDSLAQIPLKPVPRCEGGVRVRVPPQPGAAVRHDPGHTGSNRRAADVPPRVRAGRKPVCAGHWRPSPGTFDGIADNGSGAAAVLGAAVEDWRGLPFETMAIEASIDGELPIQMFTGPYRRDPLTIAAETFTDLRARGIDLPAGTCVLTGSLSLPTLMRRGQTITAQFPGASTITLTLT